MVEIFKANPILLLFLVAAIGYGIGNIRIRGGSLGVAAVLFVGLGFGALDPDLKVPEIIILMGLAIFIYTIGLSSGPGFFATFRKRGVKDILVVVGMLIFSAFLTIGMYYLLGFDAATTAGLFAGVTTNTPSLASLLDTITKSPLSPEEINTLSQEAVVGYSIAYPTGVLGVMLALNWMKKILKIDFAKEEDALAGEYPIRQDIVPISIKVTQPDVLGVPLRDLKKQYNWQAVFGRMKRGKTALLTTWDTEFELGDQIVIVGDRKEVERVAEIMGEMLDHQISDDRSVFGISRIFVSNPDIAGQRLATLNIPEKFAAIVTRVRRGDTDILASNDTVLELGDRVRFVARHKDMPKLSKLFGDSYEALSKINLFSFGLGMAFGLIIGMIRFELPGNISFQLGYAGGPLIVALILGALRRTGPIVWTLPYSANLVLRQLGLILLLAGIGIRSGHSFVDTILHGEAGFLFLAATLISCLSAIFSLWIGYVFFKIPFSLLIGMIGIASNQPVVLDYAIEQSGNQLPNIGFTLVLPVSLIAKIVIVQFLYNLLG
ncbi:UNVERIFIED_CONTAM: hypothetical protein GTU68_063892 [Idotea baltica]|nr:hypothetical protein [Idotea baltica]